MTEIWGLTGGIASGKSTVAKYLTELGIPVLDADEVSRALSAPGGAAHESIVARFGTADRERLRAIVFSDLQARKDLEGILHPLIIRESQAQIRQLAQQTRSRAVVYEASLLVETGRYKDFSGLIVVESPPEIRKERLITRNGFPEKMAEQILRSQIPDEKRREVATILINNTGSLEHLREEVREMALAAGWISP